MTGAPAASAHPRIGAVVVTYRRPEALGQTLLGIRAQSMSLERIYVVDNDSGRDPAVADVVSSSGAICVQAPDNEGYGAGLARGLDVALAVPGLDAVWMLDDDSPPDPNALARVWAALGGKPGIASPRGGTIRLGRIRHSLASLPEGQVAAADFVLVDGAVVTLDAVKHVGVPRRDLFMMLEDFEYSTRIKDAGFGVLAVGGDRSANHHLGSAAAWRSYYQSRNLLRIALDRRSLRLLVAWAIRECAFHAHLVGRQHDFRKAALRVRGACDGLRGRMGRIEGLP